MNDARHDPDEQWIDVPDGEQPWGRTVRTWVDDSGKKHVQTNVPRPVEQPIAQPADHDCTPWTERTEKRLALLEDAVNRIADKLQYLLLRLEGGGE